MPSTTNAAKLREIYLQAIEIDDDAARAAYLNEACGVSSPIRQQVENLLALSQQKTPRLLHQAVDEDSTSGDSSDAIMEETNLSSPDAMGIEEPDDPPQRGLIDISSHPTIGNYKLLEELGHGGMGTVYMAQQTQPVKRKVALKIIKAGMDTREVIARFEAERQALAMMDHPHIAKVLDGGSTDEGRPYFVMELVRGVPITEFCQAKQLGLRDRLELFIDICQAVQHAHQKGIIHRDLKPSNIMITLHDGRPVVKVIDFGVAKALNHELTERTLYTQYSQMIGTPLYMAPEQAEMSGLDVDTRSDLYSLGVILYELLTGTTPFDRDSMSSLGIDGIRKLIKENDPERPSARVSTLKAANLSTIDDQRTLDTEDITQQLKRELDWIVMKAMEKDRERRYDTANDFAADVQRYLDDEPVEACPPSVRYRLKKYVKRHKGLITTATILVGMLVMSTAVSGMFAYQANEAKTEAIAAKELADNRLKQSRLDFDRALKSLDLVVEQLSSAEFAQIPSVAKTRATMLQQMLTLYEEIAKEHDNDPYVKQQQALAYRRISDILGLTGQDEESEQAANQGVVIMEELLKASPQNQDYNSGLADLLFRRLHLSTRSKDERLADAERALSLWQSLVQEGHDEHVASVGLMHLKVANLLPPDSPQVDHHIKESIRIPESHGLTPHWGCYLELARRAEKNGDWETTEKNYRRGLELSRKSANSGHRVDRGLHANICSQFAKLLNARGNFDEARKFYLEAIDVARQLYEEYGKIPAYGSNLHQRVRAYLMDAANDQQKNEAIQFVEEFVARWPSVAAFHETRAEHLAEDDDALALLTSAIEQFSDQSAYYYHRGVAYRERGELEKALADAVRSFELSKSSISNDFLARGRLLRDLKDFERAESAYDKFVELQGNKGYALFVRGCFHLEYAKNYSKALDDFNASFDFEPGEVYRYKRRALNHFLLRNYDHALADLEKVFELTPTDTSAVWWIPAHEVAACPDENFKRKMRQFADRVVEGNKRSTDSLVVRAPLLIEFGELEQAEQDLAEVVQRGEKNLERSSLYYAGLLSAHFDNPEHFRTICSRMLEQFETSEDIIETHFTAWTCALAPNALDDYEPAIKLARHAVEQDQGNQQYMDGLGAILLRAGKYDEAKEQLEKALAAGENENTSTSYIHYFLAMTQHHLGNAAAAKQQLAKANESAEKELTDSAVWNRKLTLELLRKEAEALIKTEAEKPNSDEDDKPENN